MAKYINQVRYYGEGDPRNQPKDMNLKKLVNGNAFLETPSIVQLGIQGYPGLKFTINDGPTANPIMIGGTGIYEINVEGFSQINRLQFLRESIETINNVPSAYLIVDYIYEKGV